MLLVRLIKSYTSFIVPVHLHLIMATCCRRNAMFLLSVNVCANKELEVCSEATIND